MNSRILHGKIDKINMPLIEKMECLSAHARNSNGVKTMEEKLKKIEMEQRTLKFQVDIQKKTVQRLGDKWIYHDYNLAATNDQFKHLSTRVDTMKVQVDLPELLIKQYRHYQEHNKATMHQVLDKQPQTDSKEEAPYMCKYLRKKSSPPCTISNTAIIHNATHYLQKMKPQATPC